MKKLSSLSVFFPCFNEEKNIPFFVKESLAFLPQVANKFEIIIIDDGSTDGTKKVVNDLEKKHKQVKVVSHSENKGYGAALRTGFSTAKFDWIFFTDGDLQFRLNQLAKFIPYTEKNHVIIGYRANRAEGRIRAFNARLFKVYIDLLFRIGVKDIDCAFKLFHRETLQSLHLESTGAFTSSEVLYKLKKRGEKFIQLPVQHRKRRYGSPTGNNLKVIIKAGIEALSLYLKIKIGSLVKL
ncbi:MAG: glycosyltransferase family 2 protein [Candidatus Pacebacteria bacterium]|jgi:glycosyltransferase involved in cell wall biosynthesis|nr:glycosyltransferase family 2 protein [archaeon]MBT4124395.1 glycosyltransferase family 2 protein [Candidatus Paceibacterota bacterium]MBT4652640.1 glycosyltransferase family 2 protein [Candidatus Paceibacterota bacterium]MBT6755797.1 glycosyltransferase family 2 protein [Candidatus Paceibacterota bacterium]MBT6921010.1 glycosyltransferase family 2 protein [Candidatus Paceibacterota bacterium]